MGHHSYTKVYKESSRNNIVPIRHYLCEQCGFCITLINIKCENNVIYLRGVVATELIERAGLHDPDK